MRGCAPGTTIEIFVLGDDDDDRSHDTTDSIYTRDVLSTLYPVPVQVSTGYGPCHLNPPSLILLPFSFLSLKVFPPSLPPALMADPLTNPPDSSSPAAEIAPSNAVPSVTSLIPSSSSSSVSLTVGNTTMRLTEKSFPTSSWPKGLVLDLHKDNWREWNT